MVCVRMTMIGCAMGVISQHLDHPAIGDLPACTLHDHAFQFGLERGQTRQAAFNLS
jgi:hypothetical protein